MMLIILLKITAGLHMDWGRSFSSFIILVYTSVELLALKQLISFNRYSCSYFQFFFMNMQLCIEYSRITNQTAQLFINSSDVLVMSQLPVAH